MTTSKYSNIAVQLNQRQVARLNQITARLGVPKNRLMCAVADVATDEEILSMIARYDKLKMLDTAEKARARMLKHEGAPA